MFKYLDLTQSLNHHNDIFVILVGPIEIPYFPDGCASDFCRAKMDFEDPNQWEGTFTGYIVWNAMKERYEIHNESHMKLFEKRPTTGMVPFDNATGRLRNISGLLTLADKCYGKPSHDQFLPPMKDN